MVGTYLENKKKDYEQGAKMFYPGLKFSSSRSIFSGDEPTSCKYEFGFNANILLDTEYQVRDNINLIHYTSSIQNVLEIINSGSFRLGNMVSLNDPQEINFVINNLNMPFNDIQVEEYKNNFFSASFCEVVNEAKPDDFLMWRLYGNDGLGAAIIFELDNPNAEWMGFALGKVQYGAKAKAIERLKDFINFHDTFQKENNRPIQNLPIVSPLLMAFHKNDIWAHEKEVRLLTHQSFDPYTLKSDSINLCRLKHSISRNGNKYSYVELPLFNSDTYKQLVKLGYSEHLLKQLPILKIKKILLGYRHNVDTWLHIEDVVTHLYEEYNYQIQVTQSHLVNQMQ